MSIDMQVQTKDPRETHGKRINGVVLRDAENNEERQLLGFLHEQVQRIGYGTIVVEFTVKRGKVSHMRSTEISRTFIVGEEAA